MMAGSDMVRITTGVSCLLVTESLRLGKLLTWNQNINSTGTHSVVWIYFYLGTEEDSSSHYREADF